MSGTDPRPQRGDGKSFAKATQVLKHDWRFRETSPSLLAEEWRIDSYERWEKRLKERRRNGQKLTRGELFTPAKGFVMSCEKFGPGMMHQCFTGGYWRVYVDESLPAKQAGPTRDWGITVRVGEYTWMTAPSLVRKAITKSLGEETYNEYKQALVDDDESLRECLSKAAEYLGSRKLLGVSFVCSPSSERLMERLGIRVERGWAFLFDHYTF